MNSLQKTLKKPINIRGTEAFGKNEVDIAIYPAEPNTGVIFDLPKGEIPSSIKYAQTSGPFGWTFLLKKGEAELLCSEHILATTYSMGIDNAIIQVKRLPSKSFKFLDYLGLATSRQAIPFFPSGSEKQLCNMIQESGLTTQKTSRKILRLEEEIGNERLSIKPMHSDDLSLTAATDYKEIGRQEATLIVSPENYKEISDARAYMKIVPHWASEALVKTVGGILIYPHHGLKSGISSKVNFRQTKTAKQWKKQERMEGEIAYHTIIDKIGALALLPGRLQGAHVTSEFSNHQNDLQILKENIHKFKQQ